MALTKFNYNSFDLTTAASKGLAFNSSANGFETSSAGSMTLIKTLTASSSSTLSFVDGSSSVVLDNTYPIYKFVYTNIHPSGNGEQLKINFRDGGSSYDATKTTTFFRAVHNEAGNDQELAYRTAQDLAQGTGAAHLTQGIGTDNDQTCSGELILFNPSSTTFVKHFMAKTSTYSDDDYNYVTYVAGYCNVTAAIDGVQFIMSSGNIDAGTIKLYGIKDS